MDMLTFSAKTVDEAVTKALIDLGTTSDKLEYEVIEKGSAGFLGIGAKPAIIRARKKESIQDNAVDFLAQIFDAMNMQVTIAAAFNEEEKELSITLEGDDMGILIGKRGQTLDSLQYLVSLIVNKNSDGYLRVKLDTENYREKRKKTLETLAKNIAYKVKRTKRPVSLEPMNPYERRIIHAALQNDKYVLTRSEGEEPFRHVVIALKKEVPVKRERYDKSRTSRYGKSGGGYRSEREHRYDRSERYGRSENTAVKAAEVSSEEPEISSEEESGLVDGRGCCRSDGLFWDKRASIL